MVTVDNASYGLNNVIEELEQVLATIDVYTSCYGTKNEHDVNPAELRAKISIASMQLSALSDDFDCLVINEDKYPRDMPMSDFIETKFKKRKGNKKHAK